VEDWVELTFNFIRLY